MAVRRNSVKSMSVADAKKLALEGIAAGDSVAAAANRSGRAAATFEDWRKHDPEFKAALAEIRETRKEVKADGKSEVPDFDVFCRDYLHEPLFPHQYNAWDVLEGREPRFLDPAMTYEPGEPSRVIMNFPPSHAKTTTFSMNYVTWRIHKNPGISIAIVSKGQGLAKKILSGVKARLTDKNYRAMHLKFGPEGGWRSDEQAWTANMIYVAGKYDGETEKDPTVEAIGMGGHIYGGRFDVIILDDVVDNENVHRHEDQVDWAMTILDSRLPPDGGLMMVLGTRMGSTDFYSELRKKEDEDENQFFSYLAQPAVLEYAAERTQWRTLWPWALGNAGGKDSERRCMSCYRPEQPECCSTPNVVWLKPRWNGIRLSKKRFPLGQRRWSLVWQQQQIPDNATFAQQTVVTAINRARQSGVLRAGVMGHRQNGMEGLYVVGGLDPATVGKTAMVVGAVDRITGKRFILDGFNQAGTTPAAMRAKVKEFTDKYTINEWVIEKNAFQKFLTEDPDLVSFLQSRGCKRTAHYTTANKVDPDFGVMSMAPLFESTGIPPRNGTGGSYRRVIDGTELIELPDERQSAWMTEMVAQLIAWEPQGMAQRQKTDLVMALWFCEIAFKKIVNRGKQVSAHRDNPFAARGRLRERAVVNLAEYRSAMLAEKEAV